MATRAGSGLSGVHKSIFHGIALLPLINKAQLLLQRQKGLLTPPKASTRARSYLTRKREVK